MDYRRPGSLGVNSAIILLPDWQHFLLVVDIGVFNIFT